MGIGGPDCYVEQDSKPLSDDSSTAGQRSGFKIVSAAFE
jgi:hypothetical protein